jgi:hypothetical protein
MRFLKPSRGMSLVDVVVGTALMLVIFTALFGLLRASALVSSLAKSKAGATAMAESQMEYIRGLSYDSLGTAGGIPSGTIAQVATTTVSGSTYVVHTFIQYADDPADGLGSHDSNGLTNDYKRIRVAVDYGPGYSRDVTVVSTMAPPSVETTTGGGTLTMQVVNAAGAGVPGATVALTNAAAGVNLSAFTDDTGMLSFPGAPKATGYHVVVTKDGYSSAQTYDAVSPNRNPNPGNLTVSKNQTTTGTFAIDLLSTLALATYSPAATSTFTDLFNDSSKLAATASTTVAAGSLTLSGGAGAYALAGSARSVATTSAYLASWGTASTTRTIPSGTGIKLHIYDGSGALIPDSVLAGNSTGFSTQTVNLSGVSTSTYPSLSIGADLSTNAASAAPSIQDWSISYVAGPTPLPNVSFTLTGAKTIGSTSGGEAIYKTSTTTSSGDSASKTLSLEWDAYKLSVPSYDIVDACPDAPPYALTPGVSVTESLMLGAHPANSLLVDVSDSSGHPVSGATVTLTRTGYTGSAASSACGTAYFGGLTSSTSYTIKIAKTGYTTVQFTHVSVSGATIYDANFN